MASASSALPRRIIKVRAEALRRTNDNAFSLDHATRARRYSPDFAPGSPPFFLSFWETSFSFWSPKISGKQPTSSLEADASPPLPHSLPLPLLLSSPASSIPLVARAFAPIPTGDAASAE